MRCVKCGQEIIKGHNFCWNCGQLTSDHSDEQIDKTTNTKAMRSNRGQKSGDGVSKRTKYVIIAIAVIVVLGSVAAFFLLNQGEKKTELRLVNDKTKEYLLLDADRNIEFSLEGVEGSQPEYQVTDLNGEMVKAATDGENKTGVIPSPEGGYEPGKIYTITLGEKTKFTDVNYQQVRILNVKIFRPETANIVYNEDVKMFDPEQVTVKGNNSIELDQICRSGDLIVVRQGNQYPDFACKVVGAVAIKGKSIANVESPRIDELYKTVDINRTIVSDPEYLTVNEDILIETAKESGILSGFIDKAEAITVEDVKAKVIKQDDDSIRIKVEITDPKDKTRQVVLSFSIKYTVRIDINDQWQFVDHKIQIIDKIDVQMLGVDEESLKTEIEAAITQFEKDSKSSIKSVTPVGSTGTFSIFSIKIPIEGTVSFSSNLGMQYDVKASGKTNVSLSADSSLNQGLVIEKGQVKKQYANSNTKVTGDMLLQGRLNTTTSMPSTMALSIVDGSQISFSMIPQIHTAMKGYVSAQNISKISEVKGYYDVQAVRSIKDNVTAKLYYTNKKIEYTASLINESKPIVSAANITKVKTVDFKDKYAYKGGKVNLRKIKATYLDVIEEKETKKTLKKYDLYVDDKLVKVKNGLIQDKVDIGQHTFKVKWKLGAAEHEYEKQVEVVESFDFTVVTAASYQNQLGPFATGGLHYTNVNIVIPSVQSDTTESGDCNARIDKYCSVGKDMIYSLTNNTALPANYGDISTFQTYSWTYQVHKYREATALIISTAVRGQTWGGWDVNYAIYYDNSTGEIMTPSQYASACGLNSGEIMKTAKDGSNGDARVYVPSNLSDFQDKGTTFYADENGKLIVRYGFNF